MSTLAPDLLTQLAFSVYENKGVFALLLGSGLSRSAEVPTGWEITLDLIRRVAVSQGVKEQPDWAAWYRQTIGREPDYSALLQDLASSPEERRSILHSYIEPTEEDREEGVKIPTAAHHAIADLVRRGYVRVIVTTNFDRLMENALRERGIEPTIVASADALAGAEPITHSACYLFKLHGDYKDARILNTESELSSYPSEYDALLDRILDEHGLIICGWSGEWDHALRAALLRTPARRYSVFWAARGELGDGAEELATHRRARVVPIADADRFFSALRERIETLEQTRRQNPIGIELLVGSVKRFLAKSEYRVQLDELVTEAASRVIAQLDAPDLAPDGQWDQAEFRTRVRRYEAIAEPLASIAGVLGRWSDGSELPLLLDTIRSLCAQADKIRAGLSVYVNIRSYPAVLVFTAYGLGLACSQRWDTLHSLFNAAIDRKHEQSVRLVESIFLWEWEGTESDVWKRIEGLEMHRTAFSEHLLILFSEWGQRFVGLAPDFELLFDRFEMLGSLAYLEREDKDAVQQALANGPQPFGIRMPIGRTSWNSGNANKIIVGLQADPMKEALLKAGFAKGDSEFIDIFVKFFRHFSRWVLR